MSVYSGVVDSQLTLMQSTICLLSTLMSLSCCLPSVYSGVVESHLTLIQSTVCLLRCCGLPVDSHGTLMPSTLCVLWCCGLPVDSCSLPSVYPGVVDSPVDSRAVYHLSTLVL
jgi:hypothetical protein